MNSLKKTKEALEDYKKCMDKYEYMHKEGTAWQKLNEALAELNEFMARLESEELVKYVAKAIYNECPVTTGDIDKEELKVVSFEDSKTRKWVCIEQAQAAINVIKEKL